MTLTVMLVDQNTQFREGLKRILEADGAAEVIAEGDTGKSILGLYEKHCPDVLLIDLNLSDGEGMRSVSGLTARYPQAKVAAISSSSDQTNVSRALQAGAEGYLLKNMGADSIVRAVEAVAHGDSYIHPQMTPWLIAEFCRLSETEERAFYQSDIRPPYYLLTKREVDVLELLAAGSSNQEIAATLFISEKTVKGHVSRILDKMYAEDRTQAVVAAIKNGWVKI
ncbi:LuxR C-terminal-related transcriptional regulator [Planococcus lenghuensis]|uniref:DNA-binding response regulator n=1 Tax=Planococcus lenghuensis TaxID=2213202 RepID=A0A1Q2L5T3_9BACL|nr:response regulator transcription factor [Planococcus lenghuensis]AQQ55282.1 DNA-binding response regulator [Planococcus lenghuensis]